MRGASVRPDGASRRSTDRGHDRGNAAAPMRPALKVRDILALILATYKASFPYILLIVLTLLVITWFLTEVVFVR